MHTGGLYGKGLYLQDILSKNINKWVEMLKKMKKEYHFKKTCFTHNFW